LIGTGNVERGVAGGGKKEGTGQRTRKKKSNRVVGGERVVVRDGWLQENAQVGRGDTATRGGITAQQRKVPGKK